MTPKVRGKEIHLQMVKERHSGINWGKHLPKVKGWGKPIKREIN